MADAEVHIHVVSTESSAVANLCVYWNLHLQ